MKIQVFWDVTMCWQGTNIPHSVSIISLSTSAVTGYPSSRCSISVP